MFDDLVAACYAYVVFLRSSSIAVYKGLGLA